MNFAQKRLQNVAICINFQKFKQNVEIYAMFKYSSYHVEIYEKNNKMKGNVNDLIYPPLFAIAG